MSDDDAFIILFFAIPITLLINYWIIRAAVTSALRTVLRSDMQRRSGEPPVYLPGLSKTKKAKGLGGIDL